MLGFIGTLIILRPGLEVVTPGALLMRAGSVFVATSILLVKVLSRTESPNTMVLMVALIATPSLPSPCSGYGKYRKGLLGSGSPVSVQLRRVDTYA